MHGALGAPFAENAAAGMIRWRKIHGRYECWELSRILAIVVNLPERQVAWKAIC